MSTSDLTYWAAWVMGSAILLLVALDHRKPARRHRITPRGGPRPLARRAPALNVVEHLPVRRYRPPNPLRRVGALAGLGVMGTVIGAILAITLGAIVVGSFLLIDNALG